MLEGAEGKLSKGLGREPKLFGAELFKLKAGFGVFAVEAGEGRGGR